MRISDYANSAHLSLNQFCAANVCSESVAPFSFSHETFLEWCVYVYEADTAPILNATFIIQKDEGFLPTG